MGHTKRNKRETGETKGRIGKICVTSRLWRVPNTQLAHVQKFVSEVTSLSTFLLLRIVWIWTSCLKAIPEPTQWAQWLMAVWNKICLHIN